MKLLTAKERDKIREQIKEHEDAIWELKKKLVKPFVIRGCPNTK